MIFVRGLWYTIELCEERISVVLRSFPREYLSSEDKILPAVALSYLTLSLVRKASRDRLGFRPKPFISEVLLYFSIESTVPLFLYKKNENIATDPLRY